MSVRAASLRVARHCRDLGAGTVMRGQRLTVNLANGVSRMDQGPVDVVIPRLGEARKP
jgi:hypothetical protein